MIAMYGELFAVPIILTLEAKAKRKEAAYRINYPA